MEGIIAGIVAFCIIMIIGGIKNGFKTMEQSKEKFVSKGYKITKENNGVIIDENAHKWLCVTCLDMPIMDFSDIADVELVENGIKYKSENGVLRAVVGGALFGDIGAVVGASTAKRSQNVTSIYIIVYTNNLSMPTVKIMVPDRSSAETLIGTFNAMKNLSSQKSL